MKTFSNTSVPLLHSDLFCCNLVVSRRLFEIRRSRLPTEMSQSYIYDRVLQTFKVSSC